MSKRIVLFTAFAALLFSLAGCSALDESNDSSSSNASASSSSAGIRPDVGSVLRRFSAYNGTNTVTFNYLSASTDTTSAINPAMPTLTALYVSQGFEFDFTSKWDTSRTNFGYLTVPEGNSASVTPGVYDYSLDSAKQLVLGDQESALYASNQTYQVFDAYTPQYLYEKADYFSRLFEATSRTEYNSLNPATSTTGASQSDVDAVAKALNVYGFLTGADSKITIHHVDLYYTASTSVFTFTFYIDYDGQYSIPSSGQSSVATNAYPVGARAKLGAFGTTKVPAITKYLGS